jgi:hypothetical protein
MVLVDDHGGDAGLADLLDDAPDFHGDERGQAFGRLVEDEQVGIVDQRSAQAELLLHAARQLGRRAVAEGRQAGAGEQFADTLRALGAILAEQAAERMTAFETLVADVPEVQQCYRVSPGPDFVLVLLVAGVVGADVAAGVAAVACCGSLILTW